MARAGAGLFCAKCRCRGRALTSMSEIAIVGMACRYAEARSPRELWENVLAQRRSFRRIRGYA